MAHQSRLLEPMAHQWLTPQVFFVCQAEVMQSPPDRDAVGLDAMSVAQFDHEFIQRQVALLLDPA